MEKHSPVAESADVATSALLHSNLVSQSTSLAKTCDQDTVVPQHTDTSSNKSTVSSPTMMTNTGAEVDTVSGDGDSVMPGENKTEKLQTDEDGQNLNENSNPGDKGSEVKTADKRTGETCEVSPEVLQPLSETDTFSSEDEGEFRSLSGEESDIEDNSDNVLYPGQFMRRDSNPVLPEATTTKLETENGCKVYLVGTAHFSKESQEDVAQVIRAVQPDVVMVELCSSRINILQMDETALLEEAKNINLDKLRSAVQQSGVIQGVMHLLLLSMSAHITKELGMAPGGEFRTAFKEARKVPGCRVHLGDRPIQITLRRAIGSLSLWQKLTLAWYMITNKEPISKEEVERCKQRDLLEEMLAEMTGEYPALSNVFVHERDLFLARSLRLAAEPLRHPEIEGEVVPSVVVGVVGIGHCKGIVDHWNDEHIDISGIMSIPESSVFMKSLKWIFRGTVAGVAALLIYKIGAGWVLPLFGSSS